MLEPLKQFICDTCGGVIEKPEDGWVEWKQYVEVDRMRNHDFRICHHKTSCMKLANHKDVSDNHLNNMLDGDSMYLQLLHMLSSPGSYPAKQQDIPGIVEMIRRLTLPYYEEARKNLNEADYTDPYDYFPERLKDVINENSQH